MAVNILMPALSPTMEEGKLAKWLVKVGDRVKSGDVIAEIETDKATMEVEAVDEGKIGELLVAAGTENVKVNTPIATVLADGEAAGAKPVAAPMAPVVAAAPAPVAAVVAPAVVSVVEAEVPAGTQMVTMTVREALRDAMREEMHRDENVYLMGEEVGQYQGAYKISQGLLDEFGARRVVDTPITEMGFTGMAVGSAFAGLRPIVEFMTFNFSLQAMDHILNSAAKTLYMAGGQLGCPIVFRGPNGAAARVGTHVTIVSFGIGMTYALGAAEKLAADGIEAEVIDLRTIRPMDVPAIIESVKKTGRCVVVEEAWPQCSVASEIAAQVMTHAFDYLDAPVARVNGKDVPMPYAANLEKLALPNVDEVVAAAKAVLYI